MKRIIEVSNLSKTYRLYRGPRALFKELFLGIPSHTRVSALEDLSFQVSNGEAFGVIGDNGAGKTTLLKVLTGTAYPTSGTVHVQGSVGALLELGAGFHPEFSGRQNIYFNGAVMGLSREEIQKKEAEIIAFSELEESIDEPVKTYSSGMQMRLGFSVATGFDSEILIIDEALAVGDQRFQKKCTDQILSFKRSGGTILFCSHNLHQVRTLCDQALWLHRGETRSLGPAQDVVDEYTHFIRGEGEDQRETQGPESAQGSICWIEKTLLSDEEGVRCNRFESGATLVLEVWAHFGEDFEGTPGIGVSIVRNDSVVVYTTSSTMDLKDLKRSGPEQFFGRIEFPGIQLLAGRYYFNVVTTDQENMQAYSLMEEAEPFTIHDVGPDFGLVRLTHRWTDQ
jgi:ABC-type polysaccharide/polyol phosphate transport system ATPase subunit